MGLRRGFEGYAHLELQRGKAKPDGKRVLQLPSPRPRARVAGATVRFPPPQWPLLLRSRDRLGSRAVLQSHLLLTAQRSKRSCVASTQASYTLEMRQLVKIQRRLHANCTKS